MVCIEELPGESNIRAIFEAQVKFGNVEIWGRLFLKGHPGRGTSMSKGRLSRTIGWLLITTRSDLIGVQWESVLQSRLKASLRSLKFILEAIGSFLGGGGG